MLMETFQTGADSVKNTFYHVANDHLMNTHASLEVHPVFDVKLEA